MMDSETTEASTKGQENDPNVRTVVVSTNTNTNTNTDGETGKGREQAVATALSSPADDETRMTATPATTDSKKSKSWRLFSLPILKILQGIFLILMIGQNLPGPHKKAWPFNAGSSDGQADDKSKPVSSYYVEMLSDLYGHERQFASEDEDERDGGLVRLLMGNRPKPKRIPSNTGIPSHQNIHLTLLNHEYESYRYNMEAATTSKVQAAREFGQHSFERALGKVLLRLEDPQERQILTVLEERFLEEAGNIVDKLDLLRRLLVDTNTTTGLEQCMNMNSTNITYALLFLDNQEPSQDSQCHVNGSGTIEKSLTVNDLNSKPDATNLTLAAIQTGKAALSARVESFLKQITESLSPGPAKMLKDALDGHYSNFGFKALVRDLRKSPMRLHFGPHKKKRLYVTYFTGDMFATAVSALRKEVTAIVNHAETGDEVLVVFQSGGGTVTGYGLVAAQLLRIKEAAADLKLTIAVEQVAASGGYMAACVGDTIVCSPFAVVGSIGVVQAMPNFYERLKREGVEFHEITAGEHKRVLSPVKEASPRDLKKAKEDVEELWGQFKEFVSEQRPSLNMDLVATGDVWFGKRAVEVGLCDAIQASDNVLTDYVDRGYDVYHVKYEEPVEDIFDKLMKLGDSSEAHVDAGSLLRWFVQKIAALLQLNAMGDTKYDRYLLV